MFASAAESIPHRWFMLRALRSLAGGVPFVVSGAMSWNLALDGIPFAPALFAYFLDHGWLRPLDLKGTLPGVVYFGLSEKGRAFLEKGEAWWHSLGWMERCRIALVG